jgi:hypothetical protein
MVQSLHLFLNLQHIVKHEVVSVPFIVIQEYNQKHQEDLGCTYWKQLNTNSKMEEKSYSLIFCRRKNPAGHNEILLGMKKRGFGTGKW